ncbi:MAG: hypothetical protein WCT28_01055 [Patescibacteria group bacterium]|jgi:diadenosine tetraphosphate (Ap4A) HIT family hydrolase
MSTFVSQQNARPGVYDKVIADIAKKNLCPFCPEHLAEFHKNPIEEREFWIVTDNQYPYRPSKHNKLFIYRTHIQHFSEISAEAWKELGEIVQEQTEKLHIIGGSFFMRFGDARFTGASVSHLHCQLLQSNPDDPAYDSKTGIFTRLG